jgi:hypothetical protein
MPIAGSRDASSGKSVGQSLFFTDESAFRELVRVLAAEGSFPAEVLLADVADGKAINIEKNTPLRVIERIEGGAKVTITSGSLAGKVGFVQTGAIPKETSSEQPNESPYGLSDVDKFPRD